MISSIKTPGVYINEIDAFPPSIAQVKTAVPAFVGYTEICTNDVKLLPIKIRSLLEYNNLYGKAPSPKKINTDFTIEESKYKLYNSLRLFFGNGGGECYIVSVGDYDSPIAAQDFTTGLKTLETQDEPTLLLFPDAISLDSGLDAVQTAALSQCSNLMDRFTILDVQEIPATVSKSKLDGSSEAFRTNIGINNLKYGAAYYPYLQANFSNSFRYADVDKTFNFKGMYSSNTTLLKSIKDFDEIYKKAQDLVGAWYSEEADSDYIDKTQVNIKDADEADKITNTQDYYDRIWSMLGLLEDISAIPNAAPTTDLYNLVTGIITNSLNEFVEKLIYFSQADKDSISDPVIDNLTPPTFTSTPPWIFTVAPPSTNPFENIIEDDAANFDNIQIHLDKLHKDVLNVMKAAVTSIENYLLQAENNLIVLLPDYQNIINKLNQNLNILPPSGAIAGIYAQTDATRGVWKAPANVSINGIVGLNDDINNALQEEMNIHESGKSINALRKFTGKGFLVWGARTLAGNSNDWRYVNVRRLANMIEESTQKACMQFVFEPNVKQTWVSVKGMIQNYLTTLWNDGALAGSKREHAFFVSVGLGETMSPDDVNNGKLIVKIGYAPSRPAEFIILEFTQKQQES